MTARSMKMFLELGRSRSLAAALALLVIGGCASSTSSSSPDQAPDAPVQVADLSFEFFISKRAANDVMFEQYKLQGLRILRECGRIRRGRYLVEEQAVVSIDDDASARLQSEFSALTQRMKTSNAKLEPAGNNDGIWDPGLLTLTFKTQGRQTEIKTSIDSIATPKKLPEDALKRVSRAIRDIANGESCGNPQFFGLTAIHERPSA